MKIKLLHLLFLLGKLGYSALALRQFPIFRGMAKNYVAFLWFQELKIKYRLDKALSQKPLWQIDPDSGQITTLQDEEFYTVSKAPHWGKSLLNLPKDYRVPAQWHATLSSASVYSPSYAVYSRDVLWQQEEVTAMPAIAAGYTQYIVGKKGAYFLPFYDRAHRSVEEAALVAHRTGFNYFHTIFDVLPKIVHLNRVDPDKRIAAIISEELNKNIHDILITLLKGRPIIYMKAFQKISAEKLHVFSVPSYLPDDLIFDIRKASISKKMIKPIQDMLLPSIEEKEDIELLWISRRDYVEKNKKIGHAIRDIQNIDKIEAILEKRSAVRFCPEEHDWKKQGEMFRRAKRIVMASGSAVSNIIYCKPGTRVLLMCKNSNVNPAMFFPLFEELKVDHGWVLGKGEESNPHASFKIDLDDLKNGMDWLFEDASSPDGYLT